MVRSVAVALAGAALLESGAAFVQGPAPLSQKSLRSSSVRSALPENAEPLPGAEE